MFGPAAKNVAAGYASADAAAALRLLAKLSGRKLPALAEQRALGADVRGERADP